MAVPTNLTGSDQAVSATQCHMFGWTIRNTHATDAGSVTIYNNASAASGVILGVVSLAAGASNTSWFGPQGLAATLGVYVDIPATGTFSGSVYVG